MELVGRYFCVIYNSNNDMFGAMEYGAVAQHCREKSYAAVF
jgi:hypothetical protein